ALHPADAPPDRLSDWGVVLADGQVFEFNAGVVPYDLNTPLFTDYALKLRTVWLPDGSLAEYDEEGALDFPVGTILSKTFHYEKAGDWNLNSFRVVRSDRESLLDAEGRFDLDDIVLIETRLLVHYEEGWKAFPYVWNDAQTEATLEIAGDYREMELVSADGSGKFPYIVPDANQCAGCHAPNLETQALSPLGPKAWQLNRPYAWWGGEHSQLEYWQANDMLQGLGNAPPSAARWSKPGDATLEQRVKAYLDVNCAHCHNVAGPADTSALHLNIEAPIDAHYGVCKTPVAVGRGSGGHTYDLVPGHPDESIMVFRMEHSDPAIAMPELGRSVVHTEGVRLIRDWISQMNGEC
ncbi:MAG: hypothetical protein OEV03_01545, partial [Gammaproteobacteria bacterium]|nr:hypothetical protein [Gammaproteobacteria bacterium]